MTSSRGETAILLLSMNLENLERRLRGLNIDSTLGTISRPQSKVTERTSGSSGKRRASSKQ